MLLGDYRRLTRLRSECFLLHLVKKVRNNLEPTANQLQLSIKHIKIVAEAPRFEVLLSGKVVTENFLHLKNDAVWFEV
jgi:hypothetical protein